MYGSRSSGQRSSSLASAIRLDRLDPRGSDAASNGPENFRLSTERRTLSQSPRWRATIPSTAPTAPGSSPCACLRVTAEMYTERRLDARRTADTSSIFLFQATSRKAPDRPGLFILRTATGRPGSFDTRHRQPTNLDCQLTAVWLVPEPLAIGDQCAARTFHLHLP